VSNLILSTGIGGSGKKGAGYTAMNQSLTSAYNKMKSITTATNSIKPASVSNVKKVTTAPVTAKKVVTSGNKVIAPTTKKPSVSVAPKVVAPVVPMTNIAGIGSVPVSSNNLALQQKNLYLQSATAGYAKTRDDAINDITKAYDDAVAEGKLSIEDARDQYAEAVKQLNHSFYTDSQLTNTTAFARGLGNSQQLLGLQMGDASRRDMAVGDAGSERDKRINQLNTRIQALTKQKGLDVAQENKDYNYNVTQATADAQLKYLQALASAGYGSGGGSGGGGSYRTSNGGSGTKKAASSVKSGASDLQNSYKSYLTTKTNTAEDAYRTRLDNLGKSKVQNINPIVAATHNLAPASGANQNLSAYEKWKILKTDFGL
jgi:polyhydroxyalkanoate synthesis regulator phasin